MIFIGAGEKEEIVRHAGETPGSETCGILAGRENRVEKVYKMTNTSENPEICYFMDPKEQFKIMKEIRNLGLELVGIYHSHPGSEAYPSARDVELAFYPEASYVIVSLRSKGSPIIRAFKITDGRIEEVEVKT